MLERSSSRTTSRSLLLQCAQTRDHISDLQAVDRALGVDSRPGKWPKSGSSVCFARLIVSMRLPGLAEDEGRASPQRRAIRGVYRAGA